MAVFVFVPVIHFSSIKVLPAKSKSCLNLKIYLQSEISHTPLHPDGGGEKKKPACSSCLRVFEASQPVGGGEDSSVATEG